MSLSISIGKTHFANNNTNWNIVCGQDKNEILFGRYNVSYTENFKYVTCEKCRKIQEEKLANSLS